MVDVNVGSRHSGTGGGDCELEGSEGKYVNS